LLHNQLKITLQAAEIFHAWAQLPLPRSTFTQKQAALQAQIFPLCQPLPGVPLLLKTLKRAPNLHLALATSSHAKNFKLKTSDKIHLFSAFPIAQRVLGDDPRIPTGRGKPAPDIYLLALETINKKLRANGEEEITPAECLVFEDSVPGVEAGRRAGMRVVWCPHPELLNVYQGREKEVLAGIANGADEEVDDALEVAGARTCGRGTARRLDDGWAVMVKSLEDFDYAKYGIDV
jgi:pseudouridine-5'-monophosphatase